MFEAVFFIKLYKSDHNYFGIVINLRRDLGIKEEPPDSFRAY